MDGKGEMFLQDSGQCTIVTRLLVLCGLVATVWSSQVQCAVSLEQCYRPCTLILSRAPELAAVHIPPGPSWGNGKGKRATEGTT